MSKKIAIPRTKTHVKTRSENSSNSEVVTQVVSFDLPTQTLERIKLKANSCGVSWQSLIKVWLCEKLSAKTFS